MDRLSKYREKRDFERTPEPAGGTRSRPTADGAGRYVMHKHAASHDHFDLRLEEDGVLRSWALPKGASLEPGEKRLAVEVEDHPLDYGEFEGVIPAGEYGGGTVMLWDHGRWLADGKAKKDRINLILEGEKLRGKWTLTRMGGRAGGKDGKNWLLIKRSDDQEHPPPHERSVVSGRTMEEIADDRDALWRADNSAPVISPPDPAGLAGARADRSITEPAPQLATLDQRLPTGDWFYELKFDGYRVVACLENGQVRLFTRNGKDWTHRFPELARTLAELPIKQAVLDGEVVALLPDGISSFRELQEALSRGDTRELVYQVFDLLHLDGHDLTGVANLDRKETLARLFDSAGIAAGGRVRYADHLCEQGGAFLERICEMGLEGIICKRAKGRYRVGARSTDWRKVKCGHHEEFVVGGYTDPGGSRVGFGSLLLGAFDEHGRFQYSGRVGSGFSERLIDDLIARLESLAVAQCPFQRRPPNSRGAHWVAPEMVIEVAFTERTRDGVLRHPTFRGLREDREAGEISAPTEEVPTMETQTTKPRITTRRRAGHRTEARVAGVRITHPDRVLYPQQGMTKIELARFYESIQDWVLPGLAERPLSLLRCPQGLQTQCFYQKHPGNAVIESVPRVCIEEKDGPDEYVYVRNIQDLVALVQVGAMELHPWGSRVDNVERPDTLVFDLDPSPRLAWSHVLEVAQRLRERLEELGLAVFVRTTGGKGLHLVVPLRRGSDWDEVKGFARAVCEELANQQPARLTTNMSKEKRRGRIFLDYLRNARGATAVASYTVRARKGASVAVPLRWDELTVALTSDRYNVDNLRRRLAALREDPWADFARSRRRLTVAMKRAVGSQ